jgi:hypothetical protein
LRKQAERIFPNQKNLEKDITVLFLQTLTSISLMFFIGLVEQPPKKPSSSPQPSPLILQLTGR